MLALADGYATAEFLDRTGFYDELGEIETTRISVASSGAEGNGVSEQPAISSGGRYVAFFSGATNLVSGDMNDKYDIFVHDRNTGDTVRVSVGCNGESIQSSSGTSISADGQFIGFTNFGGDLVANDGNGLKDAFVSLLGGEGPDLPPNNPAPNTDEQSGPTGLP